MSEFPIHTTATAPPGSVPTLQALGKEVGFIPNLAATMAESPTLLEAFTRLRSVVRSGSLSGPEREAVALAVSYENTCSYCVAAHSAFAEAEGAPAETLAALRCGQLPNDEPRLRAIAAFTRQLIRRRGFVSEAEAGALLDAGYSKSQLLEVLAVIGWASLANWTHNLAGTPLDEALRDHAWTAPELAVAAGD